MKNSIIVPFDLNTARKIKSGEIEGSVLINNIEIEFVYESKDCAGPKDGNEKYSTKNLPKAHFRWDWRKYTLSKESVDKITEFVDTILKS